MNIDDYPLFIERGSVWKTLKTGGKRNMNECSGRREPAISWINFFRADNIKKSTFLKLWVNIKIVQYVTYCISICWWLVRENQIYVFSLYGTGKMLYFDIRMVLSDIRLLRLDCLSFQNAIYQYLKRFFRYLQHCVCCRLWIEKRLTRIDAGQTGCQLIVWRFVEQR